jgi:opacity protein-like surface antigen
MIQEVVTGNCTTYQASYFGKRGQDQDQRRSIMKKIILSAALLVLTTTTSFASPLVDYSEGKVAIDIAFQAPKITDSNDVVGSTGAMDGKNVTSFGITAGLGNKWAIQYKQVSPKSKDQTVDLLGTSLVYHEKLDSKEVNALYRLDKNISALVGIGQVKGNYYDNTSSNDNTDKKNILQVGFVGSVPVADKTNAYATAIFGKDLTSWTLGLSYALDQNIDMNLFYGYNKYENISWQNTAGQSDFTVKGVGYGVTYKF